MARIIACREKDVAGFTMLEVIVAIIIFGFIASAIFNLLTQTDRIHGRAVFVEGAARLAAGEAERLRSAAARNVLFEDSSYSETVSGRSYRVNSIMVSHGYTAQGRLFSADNQFFRLVSAVRIYGM